MYYNGVQLELPKKTIKVQKVIDLINNATTTDAVYSNIYKLLKDFYSDEKLEEIFGTADYEEIDLNEMTAVYNLIGVEWEKISNKPQIEQIKSLLKETKIDKLVDKLK